MREEVSVFPAPGRTTFILAYEEWLRFLESPLPSTVCSVHEKRPRLTKLTGPGAELWLKSWISAIWCIMHDGI
jgi:hypothetical protein